jgi:hypothetical protein
MQINSNWTMNLKDCEADKSKIKKLKKLKKLKN